MKNILKISALCLIGSPIWAQGLTVEKGAFFRTEGRPTVVVEGGQLLNHGVADLDSAHLKLVGDQPMTLGGSQPWQLGTLELNLVCTALLLTAPTQVAEKVVFGHSNSLLDLNGQVLTLAPAAVLENESEHSRIIGPKGGEVVVTLPLNAPIMQNPGNLGWMVSSSRDLGTVTVRRGHRPQEVEEGISIGRYYEVTTSSPNWGSAKMAFRYWDAETGDQDEAELKVVHRMAQAVQAWQEKKSTENNLTQNQVTIKQAKEGGIFTLVARTSVIESVAESETASPTIDLLLYPVPVVGNTVNLSVNSPVSGEGNLKIFGTDGRLFQSKKVTLVNGINEFELDVSQLGTSTYILLLETALGPQSLRFIK